MNMQAMMQQAQKIQKEIVKVKSEVEAKTFTSSKSFVEISVNGKKEVLKIKINNDDFKKEDIELLEDLIMVCLNDVFNKVDREIESKLGKYNLDALGF